MSLAAWPIDTRRYDRDRELVEGLQRRDADAADELPPRHRAAVIMRDVQDWTCAEIGEVLGISVGGVKTRLHRARLFIRKRLAESLLGRSLGPPVGPRDQRGKRAW